MAAQKPHTPGTFSWIELTTSDLEGTINFYGELMGWSFDEQPLPGGDVYNIFRKGDDVIGGMFERDPEEATQDKSSHWMPFISAENVDTIAAQAKAIGARIIASPYDVRDLGRMAVIEDPTKAVFSLWQAKKHNGTGLDPHELGGYSWMELGSSDLDKAKIFYTKLFGWTAKASDKSELRYTEFMKNGIPLGGMYQITDAMVGLPSHWLTYFNTDDVDRRAGQIERLGGEICVSPKNIDGVGRFTVFIDPQGAMAALFANHH